MGPGDARRARCRPSSPSHHSLHRYDTPCSQNRTKQTDKYNSRRSRAVILPIKSLHFVRGKTGRFGFSLLRSCEPTVVVLSSEVLEPKAEARDTFSTRAEDDSKDSWRKKRSAE
ncbi:BQ5605_C009g05447 [Microbotryum silenes-dioicae]|uniref:BQ5605_C009g05447 protein n=1 Tax=Microbotryum silenes-dioicae TaxID=796604 RepID=A0A2X0MCZ2_9BASI|nr:BQ5605_C009g05447 [Microbotryum silenes-dioicae]